MNNPEDNFRELLTDAPFDGSYRDEHRNEVRERALRAFDEVAAGGAPATVSLGDSSRRQFSRRRAVRMAAALVAAASLCGALVAWHERSDKASSPSESPDRRVASQSDARALADQKLVASLNLLSGFDEEGTTTFDRGVQVCLGEHYSRIASMGQN